MDRSMMDRTANVSWTDILGTLHQSVRKAVLDAGREATGTRNAKGDEVKVFDLAAEDAALAVLRRLQPPILVDSEERGRQEIGAGGDRRRRGTGRGPDLEALARLRLAPGRPGAE